MLMMEKELPIDGFLQIDDPEPIDLTDDHFRQGQFTNW